jgi:L-lactate dehydrogenase complex protein LldE
MYPQVAEAVVYLLERYGVEVDFPEGQACCGQPMYNSGFWQDARKLALNMLDAFEKSEYVVAPSGSCIYMFHHYPKLFADDPINAARAAKLRDKSYEFCQFMVNVLGVTDVGAVFAADVTYHPSCHGTRLLGVRNEPTQLLARVQGLNLRPLPFSYDCCGFGGTFAVKMDNISRAMVQEKMEHVVETGAQVLAGIDMACLLNIGGALRYAGQDVRVMHVAEILCEGLRNAEKLAVTRAVGQ